MNRRTLKAALEEVDDSSPYWRKEKVSFEAAYGTERVPAFLFLPKNAKPPYQALVFHPGAGARPGPSPAWIVSTVWSSSFEADGR